MCNHIPSNTKLSGFYFFNTNLASVITTSLANTGIRLLLSFQLNVGHNSVLRVAPFDYCKAT